MMDKMGDFAIWTGAIVGLLKIIDWLLLVSHKKWLNDKFETIWIWLSEQRLGKFTLLLKSHRVQVGFSIFAHSGIILILLAFLARVFLGFQINADLELGHPRIYSYQVWVDVFALLMSAVFVSLILHPKIASWIGNATTLRIYFWRSFVSFIKGFGCMFVVLLIQLPIIHFMPDPPLDKSEAAVIAYTAQVEDTFGGQFIVTILHSITAIIGAPVLAEVFMLQTILFLSVYWFLFVLMLILIFRIFQFFLIRIIENKNGPVLALSGLLVGLGAVVRFLIA